MTEAATDLAHVLRGISGPDLYRNNIFGVTGLPVDASAAQIRRRREEAVLESRLNPEMDADAIRSAYETMRDPVARLTHELLWTWAPDEHREVVAAEYEGAKDTERLDVLWKSSLDAWATRFADPDSWAYARNRVKAIDDPRLTTGTVRRLRDLLPRHIASITTAENAKIELSRRDVAEIVVELSDEQDRRFTFETVIRRADVERLALPLYRRSIELCRRALSEKGLKAGDIERVILVGGATMAPALRTLLADPTEGLGIPLDHSLDPVTVVARGAAIFARTQRIPRGLELDPALASAVQGRRRIAAMQAKQYRRRPWLLVVAVAGIGALGVLLPQETPSPAPAAPDLSALDRMRDKQAELASELAALRAQLASAAQPSQVIDQIEKGLSSGNFTVVRQRNAALITFTTGLFNRDARLTAKSAVADLGRQLKPFAGKALIEVTGYTDNRPVPRAFTNDVDLGFARAQAAAAELANAAGIPVAVIGLHSAGSARPPFPSGTKNNTVTVLVREAR